MKLCRTSICRKLLCAFLAYITACSFWGCAVLSTSGQSGVSHFLLWPVHRDVYAYQILFCLAFALFFGIYNGFGEISSKPQLSSVLLSLFYSAFTFIGFTKQNDWYTASSVFGLWGVCLIVLSFFCFFYCVIERLHRVLDTLPPQNCSDTPSKFFRAALPCFLFVMWFPFSLFNYPSGVGRDVLNQLKQVFGEAPFSNNNPFFDTLVYGALFKIGRLIGHSDNAGFGLINFFQLFLYVFFFSYSIEIVYRITRSRFWAVSLALFYGIVPFYGAQHQFIIKDTLHVVVLLLYFSYILKILYLPSEKYSAWVFSGLFLLSALTRKAALFYVLTAGAVLWLLTRKRSDGKRLLYAVLLSTACFLLIENLLYPALGVEKAPSREILCIPIQSISYLTLCHSGDMPPELLANVDRLFGVGNILANFNPDNADNMKWSFHGGIGELLSLYWSLVRRYPLDAVKALIATSWRYFSPFAKVVGSFRFYITDTSSYHVNIYHVFPELREYLSSYTTYWSQSALLAPLVVSGTYSWAMLFALTHVCRRKIWNAMVLIAPLCVLLAGLPFTPVNGECRYALPMMVLVPILLVLVISNPKTSDQPSG